MNQKKDLIVRCAWFTQTIVLRLNSVKTVLIADEAMKASLTPAYLGQHSVQELAEMSDFELPSWADLPPGLLGAHLQDTNPFLGKRIWKNCIGLESMFFA